MKKYLLMAGISALAIACGGNSSDKKAEENKATTEAPAPAPEPAAQDDKGIELIAASDCLTCHKVDEPLTGPSYRDVANKYASAGDTIVAHLAGKIINGGKGVWGEVFMTPHASLSQEDAQAMVKYILLLKK